MGVKAADQNFEVWNAGAGTLACTVIVIDFSIVGNGILDCDAEMAVVAEALRNTALNIPAHDSYPGLTYAMAKQAWDDIDARYLVDVGSTYWTLLPMLANGLTQTLKGFMMIGDGGATFSMQKPESDPPSYWHIETSGFGGFCQALMAFLGEFITNPNIDLNNYHRMPEYFAATGDADGDGCTNKDEWKNYGPLVAGGSISAYVAAALDPAKDNCPPDFNPPSASADGTTWLVAYNPSGTEAENSRSTLSLKATVKNTEGVVAFQWYFNGVSMGSGFTSAELVIPQVSATNAGVYKCKVTDQTIEKSIFWTNEVTVTVFPAGTSLPAASTGALVLLLGVISVLGATFVMRRKASNA